MKAKNLTVLSAMLLALAAAGFWVSPPIVYAGSNTPRIAPPQSLAHGKTLAEWLKIYWKWNIEGSDMAVSVVHGVQLMPLPVGTPSGGSGTPEDPVILTGQLEITLPPGTPFVLPLFGTWGEIYNNGNPPDHPLPDALLLSGTHPVLTIDGRTIISDANKTSYYIPVEWFDAPVPYAQPTSYGSIAAIFYQGVGFVSEPLQPGTHVIHLDEPYIVAGYWGEIFHNTWFVTVKPH